MNYNKEAKSLTFRRVEKSAKLIHITVGIRFYLKVYSLIKGFWKVWASWNLHFYGTIESLYTPFRGALELQLQNQGSNSQLPDSATTLQ